VPAGAAGVVRRDYRTLDHRRASDIAFEDVKLGVDALLGPKDGALPIVEEVADRAMAALCAEAVGCMTVLHRDTLAYVKQRKQFGRAIGDFQVIQHRLVDMMIALEQSKSMAMMANMKLGFPVKERARAVAAAKVQIGRAGRFVGQQAIQLHGGMGMSDELPVGHYMKRLMIIDTLFGNADHHQKRFAAM
jgi:alkylation response protein AidB-like acyl-CoA dehydrogenase